MPRFRRPLPRSARAQRGSTDASLIVVLLVLLVLGGAALYAIVQPRHNAQADAATLFASAWSRAEIEAPAAEHPVWTAYRTCWVKREAKPFLNQGDVLMSWKDRPSQDPDPIATDVPTTATMESFTAEDLFSLCDREVSTARADDRALPVVRRKILALLNDRENDVEAMSPPPWRPESTTRTASRRPEPTVRG